MTSKCGKNKKNGTRGAADCVTDEHRENSIVLVFPFPRQEGEVFSFGNDDCRQRVKARRPEITMA